MFIFCMNKNPWFKFGQKSHKHKKPQIFRNAKIPKKINENCMKTCKKMKKKGQKCLALSV